MDVRIVELEPIRVASVLGHGAEPEHEAADKLFAWMKSHNPAGKAQRIFGFNNPSPSPGSPNYGYELWIIVNDDVQSDDMVTVKTFPGGKYAVARHHGVENIPEGWAQLSTWVETSPYQMAKHQWLEEHIHFGPDVPPDKLVLDLYLPIKS